MRATAGLALAFFAALGLGAGCGGGPELPDLVLVTLDTTRGDHLGCYGYFRETSPVIDAFADESILFERCIVPMATTLPTHTSILTSTYPMEHGVLANLAHGGRRFHPAPGLRSFAAFCRDAGYETAAFISAAPLKSGTGMEEGFSVFDQPAAMERRGDRTTDAALAWLDGAGEKPLFLWVHYFDPHYPFQPPGDFGDSFRTVDGLERFIEERRIPESAPRPLAGRDDDARRTANAYDGEILFLDGQVARLLEKLKGRRRWERTYLLLIGDHGEGLCQHGEAAHGGTWDEQLHAPMIIRAPGEAPRRIERVCSAVDALPTLVGLTGSSAFDGFLEQASGRDALDPGAKAAPVFSQDTGRLIGATGYRYAMTTDRWKYFRVLGEEGDWSEQLFDLTEDPFELNDLSAEEAGRVSGFRSVLEKELESRVARGESLRAGGVTEGGEVDSVLLEQLRSLGYMTD